MEQQLRPAVYTVTGLGKEEEEEEEEEEEDCPGYGCPKVCFECAGRVMSDHPSACTLECQQLTHLSEAYDHAGGCQAVGLGLLSLCIP